MIQVEDFNGSKWLEDEMASDFLRQLDPQYNANAAYITPSTGEWYLYVLVRGGLAYVAACNDSTSRCMVARDGQVHLIEDEVVFIENKSGSESEFSRRDVISVEAAGKIVEAFARTKTPPSDVEWEEL